MNNAGSFCDMQVPAGASVSAPFINRNESSPPLLNVATAQKQRPMFWSMPSCREQDDHEVEDVPPAPRSAEVDGRHRQEPVRTKK